MAAPTRQEIHDATFEMASQGWSSPSDLCETAVFTLEEPGSVRSYLAHTVLYTLTDQPKPVLHKATFYNPVIPTLDRAIIRDQAVGIARDSTIDYPPAEQSMVSEAIRTACADINERARESQNPKPFTVLSVLGIYAPYAPKLIVPRPVMEALKAPIPDLHLSEDEHSEDEIRDAHSIHAEGRENFTPLEAFMQNIRDVHSQGNDVTKQEMVKHLLATLLMPRALVPSILQRELFDA